MMIKKRNKILLFLMLVLFAGPVLAIEEVLTSSYLNQTSSFSMDSPKLNLIKLKYEPYPVEPGEYFILWLEVENIGRSTVKNAEVEFVDTYPFQLLDKEDVKPIGNLAQRQQAVVKFEKIRVDKDAIAGDYDLKVKLHQGGAYGAVTKSIEVRVESVTPVFSVLVDSEPEKIRPGSVAKVNIGLKNLADSVMEDILVKVDLSSNVPFVPIGSTTEQKIERLYPGQTSTLTFDLMALPSAEIRAYKVGLNLTYHDKIGTAYTKQDIFGLLVGDSIEYDVVLAESEIYQNNKMGSISLSIYNVGPTDIKFLTTELLESENYDIISNPIVYLGNVDPDDYESADYDIHVSCKSNCEKGIPLKLKLSYKDAYNDDHSAIEEIPLNLYSGKEMALYGLVAEGKQEGGNSGLFYLILIIFIYLTYKNWKREKDLWLAIKATLRSFLAFVVRIIRSLRWRHIKRIPKKIRIFLMQLR